MSQAESFTPEAQIDEECTVKPTRQRDLNVPGAFGIDSPVEAEEAATKAKGLPEFIKKNFLEVNGDFYFQNREPAFSFKNDELKTKSTSPEVVKAIIAIAKEQEWDSLTVTGNKDFRRSVWLEATAQGIQVNGYTPTDVEKAQAEKLAAERNKSVENTVREDKTRQSSGPAKEKAQAFREGDKSEVLKQYPDLAKAYGTVSVAEKFAEKNLAPEQAKTFVQKVQESYAEKIEKEEPLPAPTVKRSAVLRFIDRFRTQEPEQAQRPAPTAQEPEQAQRPAPTAQEPEQAQRPAPIAQEPEQAQRPAPKAQEPEQEQRPAPIAQEPEQAQRPAPTAQEPEQAQRPAPTTQEPEQAQKQGQAKVAQYISDRESEKGYNALDTMFSGSYLSGDKQGKTFVEMLEAGGMPKERAILVAEVSKVKEGLAPEVFKKEMAENKKMFESLANELTKEKCRVLAMMYNERMENLRYNDKGDLNHSISQALHNRQNKIREGLEQRREVQMLDAAKKIAPAQQSPLQPGNPQQRVNLEDKQQFVDYLRKTGLEARQAEQLFNERQNRKITEPKTYAKEIAYERQQIAQMQSIAAPTETKAHAVSKFVAENIQKNSDTAKAREKQEQEKFVNLMAKNGIPAEKAQVIYEARKIQKELAPEDFAHNKQLQKNVVGQCKAEKLSQPETEKRIAQLLSNQHDWMKERASHDPAAREIISRAEASRMQEIQQERTQQERERQSREPQSRTASRGRDEGGR